jgi:cell division GTPase FtsZ
MTLLNDLLNRIFSFNKMKKEFLLIFIGDLGTNVLNDLYCNNREANHYLAISTDFAHLTNNVKIADDLKIFIGDKTDNSCGKRDFDSGLEYVKQHKCLLSGKIRKFRTNKIVLVAGLRYSSASGVIAGLSQLLRKSREEIHAVVSTPFAAEGENAHINTTKALEIIKTNNVKLSVFSCEELLQSNGGKLLIRDLDKAFEEMVKRVNEKQ